VAVATDGETYGHHHHFGEVALAWLLNELARRDVRVENFASFLARTPPEKEVQLVAPSSWSCPHGVERWRADCGCRMAPERATNQRWRAPLRQGLNWLAGELHTLFEREGKEAGNGGVRQRELLELERNALGMFTSCGWFFDDIAGIEALQVLRYAARAIELSGADGARLEAGLLERLAQATSNDAAAGSGRDLYLNVVKPKIPAPVRVAAGYAALRAVAPGDKPVSVSSYAVQDEGDGLRLTSVRTGRTHHLRVSVERHGAARLAIDVTPPDSPVATRLALADLPERQRRAVAGALRREIIARRFTAAEVTQLANGSGDLSHVAAGALLRAVSALEHDQSAAAVESVCDLADLHELEDLRIPFDVQTEFYRIRAKAPRDLARRLGFAEGD